MIDILIPTFNREQDLIKNIFHLNKLIVSEKLERYFRIIVSDNCSIDNTWNRLAEVGFKIEVELIKFRQDYNVGLEKNAVFLLQKATAKFIMYIGDDDYLPRGYLKLIVESIRAEKKLCAVIPGFDVMYRDGTSRPARVANFNFKKYAPGFMSALKLSYLGHQLSGILLKRDGLKESYIKNDCYRNLYPFIYFLAFNNLRGYSYYVPMYKVLVSIDNSKDWRYDESGLLTEIFKNFNILFPKSFFKRFLLCFFVLKEQGSWRMRIGKDLSTSFAAMLHIWKDDSTDIVVKMCLPVVILYLYFRKILSFSKRIFCRFFDV